MFYLRYLCLLAYSGVQHILCCVFLRHVFSMLPVSLVLFDCPFGIISHLLKTFLQTFTVATMTARYVTNRQRNTSSVGDMLQHLEWRSLEDRRRDARLVMMYKISHDKVAVSKSDRLSPPLRHSRNMHSRSYQVPLCRTQQRKASFFFRTIVDLNRLPQTAVLSDSVESFRTAMSTSHPF